MKMKWLLLGIFILLINQLTYGQNQVTQFDSVIVYNEISMQISQLRDVTMQTNYGYYVAGDSGEEDTLTWAEALTFDFNYALWRIFRSPMNRQEIKDYLSKVRTK